MKKLSLFILVGALLGGCAAVPVSEDRTASEPAKNEISTSLFASDKAVMSDEAVKKALDGVVRFPSRARVALLDVSPERQSYRYYGSNYWRSEAYMNQQQRYFDALSLPVTGIDEVKAAVPMPSFTVNKQMTLSQIREAAVRMQIDALVIYALRSDIFEKSRLFSATEVKGFATCEVAILDTRTGIMPYTDVMTVKEQVEHQRSQEDLSETRMRAELQASEKCLGMLGEAMSEFIDG
ncbi:hypothetical protein [Alcanivorax sp.]|uniref:hypothetical protein n=1 Tax=Alcanivorax sp. TaxID=1872427 RepID=UPI0025BDB610|nr:hypothetical protein [Alcanivorax sp.]